MSEIKIYLTEDLHTQHLQEASCNLIAHNLRVTDKCAKNLQILSPRLSPEIVHERVAQLMDPYFLTKSIISKWNEYEKWVARMLVEAKALSYPENTDSKLGEHLHTIDQFTSIEAALGFIYTMEARLKNLLSMKAPQQLSFIGYGAFAYAESRILRKAVYNRVFLTNPKVVVVPFNLSSN